MNTEQSPLPVETRRITRDPAPAVRHHTQPEFNLGRYSKVWHDRRCHGITRSGSDAHVLTAMTVSFFALRLAIGTVFAVAPRFAVERWLGTTAAARVNLLVPRLCLGARDLVLSTGGIVSFVVDGPVWFWLGAAALAEAIDAVVAAVLARRLDAPLSMRVRAVAGPAVLAGCAALLALATTG